MFEKLKKTSLGKKIHRVSRLSIVGWPLSVFLRFVQSEAFQVSHLYSVNRAHNRKQNKVLERFERGLR